LDEAHILTLNWDVMARDRPSFQDNLCMKFLVLHVDFNSLRPDPLGSKKPAQVSVKDSYPLLKIGYFTAIVSCNVKTVADRHTRAAYHNKHW